MRKLLVVGFIVAACASAEPLTPAERHKAMQHLEKTRAAFLASIKGLSADQWGFKPAPEVWSVAEVAEHITVSEATILELVQKKVLAAPADPATQGKDDQVLNMVPDRTERFKAPEFLQPKARWTQAELPGQFTAMRNQTMEFVRATQEDLRGHAAPHPVLKALDAYQWVLLLSAHSQRHTSQIEEVKAHANFPKGSTSATLTPAERDKAISHLEKSRATFLAAIRGLSAEQWKFKPAPEVWSVGEVAEHITLSEGSLMDLIEHKVMKAPPDPELAAKRPNDDDLIKRIEDRTRKGQAPEFLQPKANWTLASLPGEFGTRRARTLQFVRTTQENLRGLGVGVQPGAPPMDAYQYVLLITAHTLRHTAQIEEVKANAHFPKK